MCIWDNQITKIPSITIDLLIKVSFLGDLQVNKTLQTYSYVKNFF